ncbi:MAG: GatB/YqeY domain-containing protein [Flavobacteriaceae bacterium]|nr:GatB/YqeY domain-containing protein [Flavobacteriaceae bacterium]
MSLQQEVMTKLKEAMKAKDKVALESLRAIKSALLIAQKSGDTKELKVEDEIKLVQKLVKQCKDSATLYLEQDRKDLAALELAQIEIFIQFLPEKMSENNLKEFIEKIILQVEATSMKDMGKVMGIASKKLAGKADGKSISKVVKDLLG